MAAAMNIPNGTAHLGFDGRHDPVAATPDGEASWYLTEEVFRSLSLIATSVDECIASLPTPSRSGSVDRPAVQERFVMQQAASQSGADTAKCVLVMEGAAIVQAELQIKIRKHPNTIHKTSIHPDAPWWLCQLQDAANMLAEARRWVEAAGRARTAVDQRVGADTVDVPFLGCLAARLTRAVDEVMLRLRRGRDALLSPRKRTIEDHLNSENMRALRPPLPGDIAVSFFVQGHRLMLAVYHLVPQRGSLMFDMFLAESSLARLETVLVGVTRTFQMCQQVQDKLSWATTRHQRARRPAASGPVRPIENGL